MPEPVSLREYFEALRAEDAKALRLATDELHRRLDDLNHAHAIAQDRDKLYVTDEKFEAFVARFEENKDVTAEALTLARGNALGRGTRSTDWARSLTLVLATASLVVAIVVGVAVLLR